MTMTITDLLILHESERLKMYPDSRGKMTIGIGHNLTDKPITQGASRKIFADDLIDVRKDAATFPWFAGLNEVRQAVVLDMLFNLGLEGMKGFVKLRAALVAEDYIQASAEILNSHIAPKRAEDLAAMMQTGEWIEPERG